MKKKSILLLLPFAAMALAGCGDKPAPNQCESAVVVLNKQAITVEVGDSETLVASMSVEGCTLGDVAWSSDHPEIAKVEDGKVTGVSVGTAVITANGATCTVTVTQSGPAVVHVTGMTLVTPSTKSPNMVIGETLEINVEIEPENASNKLVTVTSNNPDVAKINDSGEIEAVAKGDAEISIVSDDNPEIKQTIYVHVSEPSKPTPTETSDGMELIADANLVDGDKIVISSVVEDKYFTMPEFVGGKYIAPVESTVDQDNKLVLNANAAILTVEVNDSALSFKDSQGRYLRAMGGGNNLEFVATLDDGCKFSLTVVDGVSTVVCTKEELENNTLAYNATSTRFSFYKPGTAEGYPKINIYKKVSSDPVPVTGVEFEAASYEVGIGLTQKVKAHVLPATADIKDVTYSLDAVDPAGCVTIDGDTITGVTAGTAKVVATSIDGNKTAAVSVTVKELPPIIKEGIYKFSHTRAGTKYYMKKGETATSYPTVTTDAAEAAQLEFIAVEGKKDTFLIATVEDEPVYLHVKDFSENQLYFGSFADADEWTVAEGSRTDKDSGVLLGAYDIYTADGDSKRYISMYENNKTGVITDFRTYSSATSTNRKENSDLDVITTRKLTGIEVTAPTKTTYFVGQTLDQTGMVVTAKYDDGTSESITNYVLSKTVLDEVGTIEIIVSYKGKTDTFLVTVNARSITSIALSGSLTKNEYFAGEVYESDGLVVTATYDNGDIEELSSAFYTLNPETATATYGTTSINFVAQVIGTEIKTEAYACSVTVKNYDDGVHQAVVVASRLAAGEVSEEEVTITGKITFTPGNNLVVQDGDHAFLIYKSVNSTKAMAPGAIVSVTCKVQNYSGTYETVKITSNDAITFPEGKEITVNKATITSSELMEAADQEIFADFKNLVLKTKPAITADGDAQITVNFSDNAEKDYTFFVKKSFYVEALANELNSMNVGGTFDITNAYIGVYNGKKQVCSGLDSVVTDKTEYAPESVVVTKGGEACDSINMAVGSADVTLTANVLPAKAPQDIVWSVSPAGVVSIDNGVVTAIAEGDAVITATADGTEVSKNVAVHVSNDVVLVESVTLSSTNMTGEGTAKALTLTEGGTETMTATVLPEGATNKDVAWTVTDASPAGCVTVNNGVVSAVTPGTAKVVATHQDQGKEAISDSCAVTVTAKTINVDEVSELTIDATSLGVGTSYAGGSSKDGNYTWSDLTTNTGSIQGNESDKYHSELHNNYEFSKEIKYVKVEIEKTSGVNTVGEFRFGDTAIPEGNAVAIGKGSEYDLTKAGTLVLKSIASGSKFFSFKPTGGAIYIKSITFGFVDYVAPAVESVTLDQTELAMNVGDDVTLVPTILPANAEPKSISWQSDKEEVATVTNGLIHAVAEGTATITVTIDGKTAFCDVTVEADEPFDPTAYTAVTKSVTFDGSITPDPKGDKSCVWTNENVSITVNKGTSGTVVGNTNQQYIGDATTTEIRMYKGQDIVFDLADETYVILGIEIQLTNNSSSNFENSTFTNLSFTKTSGTGTIGIANPYTYSFVADKLVTDGSISVGGAFRILSISVTYGIPKTA